MARGSALITSEVAKESVHMFDLVELQFSTTVYLTNSYKDVAWNGNTYLSTGLLSMSAVTEDTELSAGSINVTLSGVDQDNISTALTEDFINDRVLIYRGFFNDATVIVDPVLIFDGRIDSFDMPEDVTSGTSNLIWSVLSHWADFEKIAGRRTNHNDQIRYYPNDKGFEFASEIIKDIKWGRA